MTAPLVARKGHQRMDQIRAVIRAKLEDWKLGLGNTEIYLGLYPQVNHCHQLEQLINHAQWPIL